MLYGLLGRRLSHSFSKRFFTDKFAAEGIPARYENFELPSIEKLPDLLALRPDLMGFNVTIPYKVEILPYLDRVSEEAAAVGAVNVVKVEQGGLHGHNTDVHGFRESLAAFYQEGPGGKALVLGAGALF
jgi:shikimate dehydrogenase